MEKWNVNTKKIYSLLYIRIYICVCGSSILPRVLLYILIISLVYVSEMTEIS